MIYRTTADLRARNLAGVIGVVPTMGALHDGHLSLVRAAKAECDSVIVTIFVNPKQFNNPADLEKYPRTEAADAALLASLGVDAIFAPAPEEVYPAGFATTVSVGGLTGPMEGAHRPGHFDGMATVVTKLFNMTRADRAYFGEKDWQQLQVVTRFVADLDMEVAIVPCPTLRETDGLAMSSRNVRLSAAGRTQAPALHRAMQTAAAAIRGGMAATEALAQARTDVLAAGFTAVDYLDLRSPDLLEPVDAAPARLLAAAMIEDVRLIDNIAV